MSDHSEAMELVNRLEGTVIADLKSLVEWAGNFDQTQAIGTPLGGLNFTLSLVSLVACEAFGFFATGAAQHQPATPCERPDPGMYMMEFIRRFFPKGSYFRKLEKVLADFLRHDLVHGFGSSNPNVPFELGIFISKDTSNRLKAGCKEGKKLLKINAIALAQDTIDAFYTLMERVRQGKDTKLLANVLQATHLSFPVSKRVSNQFAVLHRYAERHGLKA